MSGSTVFSALLLAFSVARAAAGSLSLAGFASLPDPAGSMTPEAAWEAAGAFQPLDGPRVHLGYTSTDHWFAIEIQGDRVPEEFVLEVCNPRLGEVTLFSPDGSGGFHARAAGVRSPFWSREIHALAPAFRMAKPQDGPTRHLIRVRNQGSMRFDLRLWDIPSYEWHKNVVFAAAIATGVALLVLALFNLCVYAHLRQPGYLWIALFLLACTLRQMTATGIANMFLWPDASLWARNAMALMSAGTIVFGILMANNLLETRLRCPRWGRLQHTIAALATLAALLGLAGFPESMYLLLAAGLVATLSVTACAIHAATTGAQSGLAFLLAWGLVLLGALLTNLAGPGLVPYNWVTEHLIDVALLGAGLAWSFTLTGQIRVRQEEQQRILAARVGERTAELKHALDTVRTLRGLLPICSCCKKIRDGRGDWQHVEAYLARHTEADFSHGLCPECAEEHYPKYFPPSPPLPQAPDAR